MALHEVGDMSDCYSCEQTARLPDLPPRESIWVDDQWRVAHAFDCSLPGWLVVVPRRHVEALDELTAEELAALGPLFGDLTRALRAVTGCTKTYVALFAELKGFAHVHFHVVPRMPDFADDQRGPNSLDAFLGAGEDALSDDAMDEIAVQLRAELARI